MKLTVGSISNLPVLLSGPFKEDIENFISFVRFLAQTFAGLRKNFIQISEPCPSHDKLSCNNGETHGGKFEFEFESESGSKPGGLSVSEVDVIMNRLGMNCGLGPGPGHGSGEMGFGPGDFESLFAEDEPSLEEIRETFGVFDANKDGYIDSHDLQRVVLALGLKDTCGLDECTRMIRRFDRNGDGVIDFGDFVKLMEKCLC